MNTLLSKIPCISMASMCFSSSLLGKESLVRKKQFYICRLKSTHDSSATPVGRRLANYEPSLWSYDHIQSLSPKYKGKDYATRADGMKEVVKTMLQRSMTVDYPLGSLELVDDLQRLGISYQFKVEINNLLETLYYKTRDKWENLDLNIQSLGFRLLRQHGFPVHQDIFHNFKDRVETLDPHRYEDIVGILNLYEASYHSFENEMILDEVREFTTTYLKENQHKINGSIASLVTHALDVPLHWRAPRVEARWFIEFYEKRRGTNPALIELAKLDFDMVQVVHIEDLKHASRWWRNTSWDTELTFARDRLVECFMWTIGYSYMPRFSLGSRNITKVIAMITVIDDVYDVYGTLDELEQFTDAISRWDINALEELPDYMKICFLGLYNTINEIAYHTLINTRILVLPYLTKAWEDLCKAYLVEARWYHSKHTPSLEEYLDNACVTIGIPLTFMHIKCSTSITSTQEIVQWLEVSENIVHHTALIVRLADDLATSPDEMKRGDIPKSAQCYMRESGATEEEARSYIKDVIVKTWKKLNKERANAKSQLLREVVDYAMDIARMALFMYGEGDGHARPNDTKSHVLSLLFNSIQGA